MSSQSCSAGGADQLFSDHRHHQMTMSTESGRRTDDNEFKDRQYGQYIAHDEAVLLSEFESARRAFDQVAEERDRIDEDSIVNLATSAQVNRRYLEANNRLARAGMEYRSFVADVEALGGVVDNRTSEVLQEWNASETSEWIPRYETNAEREIIERYSMRLRESNEHRIVLAEQNLELMKELYVL